MLRANRPLVAIGLSVALGALTLSGCSGQSKPQASASPPIQPPSQTASEAQTFDAYAIVIASDVIAVLDNKPAACKDTSRTRGIAVGDQILLSDASGRTVSTATLEAASGSDLEQMPEHVCAWTATFENVPTGGDFYAAELEDQESESVAEADLVTDRLVIQVE